MSQRFFFLIATLLTSSFLFGQICSYDVEYRVPDLSTSVFTNRNNKTLHIAVVVHVIKHGLQRDSISDKQIFDQISVLNRDYNLENNEWKMLPLSAKNTVGNANIVFYLAKKDPNGEAISGITRTTNTNSAFNIFEDIFHSEKGGHSPWPNDQFLNIWVLDLPEGMLGFASSPDEIGEISDGVVINSNAFGISPASHPFILGRTLVHEIGHYLGLLHPWGSLSDECEEDDGIADTPIQYSPHRGCPPTEYMGCETNEPIYWNFMDYTPDCCMAFFSQGQVSIMRHILENDRSSLVEYGENNVDTNIEVPLSKNIAIYPNPVLSVFSVDWTSSSLEKSAIFKSLVIFDFRGRKVSEIPVFNNRNRVEVCAEELPKGLLLLFLEDKKSNLHFAGRVSLF